MSAIVSKIKLDHGRDPQYIKKQAVAHLAGL